MTCTRLDIFQQAQHEDAAFEQSFDFEETILPPPASYVRKPKSKRMLLNGFDGEEVKLVGHCECDMIHLVRAAIGKELETEKISANPWQHSRIQADWDQLLKGFE